MCGYMGTIVDEVLCIARGALTGVSDKAGICSKYRQKP